MSLVLDHVQCRLPEFTLSANATFDATITGLCGPSGAGKTTLLEMIAGLRAPTSGKIQLHGVTLTDVAGKVALRPEQRRIGYVPQDLALFPHLTAEQNLKFGFHPGGESGALLKRVIHVLEIAPLLHREIAKLSGGEKQRLALGRALLSDPKLLLLDEPLSNLDDRLKARIMECLKLIYAEFKVPMIYVSHSASEIATLCDAVYHVHQGMLGAVAPEG